MGMYRVGMLLVLCILSMVALSIASVYAEKSSVVVVVGPARDGVELNIDAKIVSGTGYLSEGYFSLESKSVGKYYEEEKRFVFESGTAIEARGIGRSTYIRSPFGGALASMLTNFLYMMAPTPIKSFEMKGCIHNAGNFSEFRIEGVVDTVNGTVEFLIDGNATLKNLASSARASIAIRIPVAMVPSDFLSQLPMIEQMMSADFMNMQLKMQGIEGIEFRALKISHRFEGSILKISVYLELYVDNEKYFESLARSGKISLDLAKELIELNKEMAKLRSSIDEYTKLYTRFSIAKDGFSGVVDLRYEARGDIEKYFRYSMRYLMRSLELSTSMYIAPPTVSTPSETTSVPRFRIPEELKPWTKLVVLPSNFTAAIALKVEGKAMKLVLTVRDLRVGHTELLGDEASREVASLMISALKGLKEAMKDIDIRYTCKVKGAEAKPELVKAAAKAFSSLLQAAPPTATPITATTTFITLTPPRPSITVTKTTVTASIPLQVISIVLTKTVVSPVTVFVAKTATLTSYVTKIVTMYRTVTETSIKTLEKVSTVTQTKVLTTATPTTGGVSIAIAVIVAVIAFAVGYLIARIASRK